MHKVTKQQLIVTFSIPLIDVSKYIALQKDTISQKIYKFRKLNNLRQKDLAKILGVCSDTVGGYEKGRTTPNKTVLNKLKEYKII